ncbi:MAG: winged helix-turn-helix transcriptional regulator [Candidatus Lokiarchaeota archaeon]|nr:winged helix-turn-helix transcriptional regulator [Candidatus Lokiarchaeota archaeon]
MTPRGRKYKKEGLEIISVSSKSKNETLLAMTDPDIKAKNIKDNRGKVLQGKTLQVYWYIMTHHRAGVREIQKALKMVSSGTVAYQLNKLVKAGIISKNDKDGKYYVKEGVRKGVLGFYFRIGPFMIPRYSLYLVINILGVVGYVYLASIYGDMFITNPASLLFLIFIIFCTCVFIFESIKIWQRKPT